MFLKDKHYYQPKKITKMIEKELPKSRTKGMLIETPIPKGWAVMLIDYLKQLPEYTKIALISAESGALRVYLSWAKGLATNIDLRRRVEVEKGFIYDVIDKIEDASRTLCMVTSESGRMVPSIKDEKSYVLCEEWQKKLNKYDGVEEE